MAAADGGGEVGAPPKFPNVTDFDGSWHFCRLMYRSVRSQQRGLGWGTDYPYADINFRSACPSLPRRTSASLAVTAQSLLVGTSTDPEIAPVPVS